MKKTVGLSVVSVAFASLMLMGFRNIPVLRTDTTALISLPTTVTTIEDLATIKVGDTLALTLASEGITLTSSDATVASVSDAGVVTGLKYGRTVIKAVKDTAETDIPVIVTRTITNSYISQANNLPAKQGDSNLFLYSTTNGDIEADVGAGLANLALMADSTYTAVNGWWDNTTFVNSERVHSAGVGAMSFKAPSNGTYTLDYEAWLQTSIRKDANYSTWTVDGFSTGIAKKDKTGAYSVLYSDIGTKDSVVTDATRIQLGEESVELVKGEELMFFWASNGNGDADEIYTKCTIETVKTETYTGTLAFDAALPLIDDAGLLYVGNTTTLNAGFKGLTYASSNTAVATVDDSGVVTGVATGTTVLTATDGTTTGTLVLAVKTPMGTDEPIYSQKTTLPTKQGENNMYVYSDTGGDIESSEDTIKTKLASLPLEADSAYTAGNGWWDEKNFLNTERIGLRGTGGLAYEVPEDGHYRTDYTAYLNHDIRVNASYLTWDVDGYSVGVARINKADGSVTLIHSDIGTKESVHADSTRILNQELVTEAKKGDRLIFWYCTNGNQSCDEINETFAVQRTYLEGDEKTIGIQLAADNNAHVAIGSTLTVTKTLTNYVDQAQTWTSSDPTVATVDANGVVTGLSFGYSKITLTISKWSASLYVFVDGAYTYDKKTAGVFAIPLPTDAFDGTISVTMDGNEVPDKYLTKASPSLSFLEAYMLTLSLGDKNVSVTTANGTLSFVLTVMQSPADPVSTSPSTSTSTSTSTPTSTSTETSASASASTSVAPSTAASTAASTATSTSTGTSTSTNTNKNSALIPTIIAISCVVGVGLIVGLVILLVKKFKK